MRCKYCNTSLKWDSIRIVGEGTSKIKGVRGAIYCPNDKCPVRPCTDYYKTPSNAIKEAHHFTVERNKFMDEY